MQDKISQIFKQAKYSSPSDLTYSVSRKVALKEKTSVVWKSLFSSIVLIFSFWGMISATKILISDISQSGFYEYLNLIITDFNIVLSYWREFSYSIFESFPSTSIIYPVSFLLVFSISARYLLKQLHGFLPSPREEKILLA